MARTETQAGEMMAQYTFALNRDFVELHVLIKLLALAPSGGAAKVMIASGQVSVDGVIETRKACKIRSNHVVCVGNDEVRIVSEDSARPNSAELPP